MKYKTKLGPGGRVVIPAAFRKAMGLAEGDEVLMRCEDGEVTLYTQAEAVRRAQALVERYLKDGESMVDDLLQGRRRQVEGEEAEAAAERARHKAAE